MFPRERERDRQTDRQREGGREGGEGLGGEREINLGKEAQGV
jgi:hypothetical protein